MIGKKVQQICGSDGNYKNYILPLLPHYLYNLYNTSRVYEKHHKFCVKLRVKIIDGFLLPEKRIAILMPIINVVRQTPVPYRARSLRHKEKKNC